MGRVTAEPTRQPPRPQTAGGGQLRPAPGETPAQALERVEAAYHWGLVPPREPGASAEARAVYGAWLQGAVPGSAAARAALHTAYHQREKTVAAAIQDW